MSTARIALYVVAVALFVLGAIAVPFVLVYLMGAVGTGGREAVGELLVAAAVCGVGLGGGFLLWRAAVAIRRSPP